MPQIRNNVFTGGGDDACDLEGDFVISGNLFMNFNKDSYHSTEVGEGNSISSGDSHLVGHTYWVIGNVFYNDAHAELIKGKSYSYFINNTVINCNKIAISFEIPGDSNAPGRGAYIDGTIFWNTAEMFQQLQATTELTINRSIVPPAYQSYGVGNLYEDPRLVNPAGLDFTLRAGSPALGMGPNGIDIGAKVALGASISGEPDAQTRATSATLTVGGPGVLTYKYRLNVGEWSAETPVATPVTLTGLTPGIYTVFVVGKDNSGTWQSVPAASKTWTVDTSFHRIQINEVLAVNTSGVDHEGTWPDMVELVNSGAVPVDLAGMALSDKAGNATKYVFPAGTVLGAGEYLVLYADDADSTTSGLHLGFKLDGDCGAVYLFDSAANGSALLDSVAYGKQVANMSIGRVGHDGTWTLTQPSFGAVNVAARTGDPSTLKINEWLTGSEYRVNNDFVELYNPDPLPVPLAGLSLTDNLIGEPGKNVLPALSYVAGCGCVSYVADGDPDQGSNHLNFQLSSDKEWIALQDASLRVIDKVVHYDQTVEVSQGRSPDGAASPYAFLSLPTPGVGNAVSSTLTDLAAGLRVTEIMFNPAADGDLEFIELLNVSATTLDLAGVRLGGGVDFTFPAALLAPGQYAVVARNMAKFSAYYGPGINLLGQYDNKLSDGGDSILLELPSPYDTAILRFDFSDAWYPATDGGGYALAIVNPVAAATSWSDQASWQIGAAPGGSPGRADAGTIVPDVVINEVLSHTDEPLSDAIELYNRTGAAIDLGGWFLSDAGATLNKFRIPDGTILPAHGYLVFSEGHWVDHVLVAGAGEFGGATGFALNSYNGDQVWLSAADSAGNILRVVDYVDFPAIANGESFGRWPNGAGNLYPMQNRTLTGPGNDNAYAGNGPRVGPVIVSEILYAPTPLTQAEIAAGFTSADDMEYVEIHNPTSATVEFSHWHLADAVTFDFAAGTTLASHGTLLVVPFDPANAAMLQAFRSRYGLNVSVAVLGPYSGRLSDTGETLVLQDSDDPPLEAPSYWPPLLEDEVVYTSAWGAAGNGQSLQRTIPGAWGMDAASWTAWAPFPGRFSRGVLAATVASVAPNPRNSALSQVQIVFTTPVTGFDLGDLRLTHDGSGNLLTGSQTLVTSDNITWTLGNLTGLTGSPGAYSVTLVAAGSAIQDDDSNTLTVDASASWIFDSQGPTVGIVPLVPSRRNSAVSELQIVFNEAIAGLDLADLRLTHGGPGNLLTGTQTLTTSDNVTWVLGNLSGLTAAEGDYELRLVAAGSGIADLAGNPLASDALTAWSVDTSLPSVQIRAITPNPTRAAVAELQIVFSEAITGLDLADVQLTRDSGLNLLTGSQTLTSTDQVTWILGGLSGLTAMSGTYRLTLAAAGTGIQDLAANPLAAGASASWVADFAAPTATIPTISPRDSSLAQLTINFSEPVFNFTLASVALTLDNVSIPLAGTATLETSDNMHWTLGGLSSLTGTEGAYRVTVSSAGITDQAQNPMVVGTSASWIMSHGNLDADGNGRADALSGWNPDPPLPVRPRPARGACADALGSQRRANQLATQIKDLSGQPAALGPRWTPMATAGPTRSADGILILRYLFDPDGPWAYADAMGSGATRTTRDAIRAYLDPHNPALASPVYQEAFFAETAVDGLPASSAPLVATIDAEPAFFAASEASEAVAADSALPMDSVQASLVDAVVAPRAVERGLVRTGAAFQADDTLGPSRAATIDFPRGEGSAEALDSILTRWQPSDAALSPTLRWPSSLEAERDLDADDPPADDLADRMFAALGDLA